MRTKQLTKDLPIKLPQDKLQDLSRAIACKVGERDDVEKQKKDANAQFNDDLKNLDGQISGIADQIRHGTMESQILCEISYDDPQPGFKSTRRLDTNAMIGEPEPMDDGDRQSELFTEGVPPLDLEKVAELPDDRKEEKPENGEEPPKKPRPN